MTASTATTLDAEEIAKFTAIAAQWWDETGKFAPLHRINPVRMGYILQHALALLGVGHEALGMKEFAALTALDIGCGGGLVSEPLARMGFAVTGIDGGEKNIKTAQAHALQSGLDIDYRCMTAEELASTCHPANGETAAQDLPVMQRSCALASGKPQDDDARFDLVLALEIVEHVADVPLFLESCAKLVKPGGMLIMSTLNRTVKAYALAILGAEYVLRWLPRGTHDWKKFLKPHEIVMPLQRHGLTLIEMQGLVLNPLKRQWEMSATDIDVNYMVVLRKD